MWEICCWDGVHAWRFKHDPFFQDTFRIFDPDWHGLLKVRKKSLAHILGRFCLESLIENLRSKNQLFKVQWMTSKLTMKLTNLYDMIHWNICKGWNFYCFCIAYYTKIGTILSKLEVLGNIFCCIWKLCSHCLIMFLSMTTFFLDCRLLVCQDKAAFSSCPGYFILNAIMLLGVNQ